MSKKRILQFILTFFFFTCLVPFSGAQDRTGSPAKNRNERRYIQRLAWAGDGYTLRYEILVEKEEDGKYIRVSREYTSDSFIELPLQPGNYRCCVIPYDFLDRPGEGSEWMFFEIPAVVENEAPEPEPEPVIAEIEPEQEQELNLESESELETEIETPKLVKKEKPLDFYFGADWMPILPAYGVFDQIANWSHTLYSGGLRFGMVTFTNRSIDFGMEIVISRYNIYSDTPTFSLPYPDSYDKEGYVEAYELNLLAQKWFPKRETALNFRVGVGYISFHDSKDDYNSGNSSVDLNGYFLDLGFSFLLRPVKHYYLEIGIDHIRLSSQESLGLLRPWLGMGLRF